MGPPCMGPGPAARDPGPQPALGPRGPGPRSLGPSRIMEIIWSILDIQEIYKGYMGHFFYNFLGMGQVFYIIS